MKDIDFDELDRAVNSLMSPADAAPAVPATEPVGQTPTPAPVPDTIPETVAPATAPTRPTAAAPATRRGGRFMDMVHSSSDMKPRSTTTPSREGVTITPSRPITSPVPVEQPVADQADQVAALELEQTGVAPTTDTTLQGDEAVTATVFAEESSADGIVMPDPIDIAKSEQSVDEAVSDSEENSSADDQADAIPANDSPFLSDAKVEKRPLNSEPLSAPEPLVDLAAALNDELPADDEMKTHDQADENSNDEPPAVPAVPELNSELVAIESGERSGSQSDDEIGDKDLDDEDTTKKQLADKPVGPASIVQQYKTVESTGDKSHAAIYDATQYPEPLAHPAKKKSGWLWVVWVIVLLALGSGGAIGLYAAGIIP